jgi:hypothetical protein
MPKKIPASIKRIVRSRAREYCEYCISPEGFSTYNFSTDHIIPPGKGGTDDPENLALACQGCNGYKYDKTEAEDPVSGDLVPFFNPRKDSWSVHFYWSEDYTEIIGKTPSGRTTVDALKLNREKLINLRKGLFRLGEHPPVHLNEL